MKTEWDYTNLADAYLKRPAYAPDAIAELFRVTGVRKGDPVCDVGAGTAHLTRELAKYGLFVRAVEPNDAMRSNGITCTREYPNVTWSEGVGEHTGQPDDAFRLVTFGSSFNVCDRAAALQETARILQKDGFFACMWNHRDLEDALQKQIEQIIQTQIPDYSYGTRREDQSSVIASSGLFAPAMYIEGRVLHQIDKEDFIEGWRSHGTVYRQSPAVFQQIIAEISALLHGLPGDTVQVPYTTRMWVAQVQK